jgi:hypothetical protein
MLKGLRDRQFNWNVMNVSGKPYLADPFVSAMLEAIKFYYVPHEMNSPTN